MPSQSDRQWNPLQATGPSTEVDQDLRAYMLRVYAYMGSGLLVTALMAYLTAATGFYLEIYRAGVFWIVLVAPIVLVMILSFRIRTIGVGAAQTMFWAYAMMIGLSLSGLFIAYTGTSIAETFAVASAMFLGMSLYGYSTGRDLSGIGSFLFMGLIGITLAGLVNLFLHADALQFAISIIGVVVFTGLTAWDTQRTKQTYYASLASEERRKSAIIGALTLYLDFINLFLMLLRFTARRRN